MALSPQRALPPAFIAVVMGLLLFRVAPYLEVHQVEIGDRAPDFDLQTEDGSGLRLSDYRGKYVLLNFWATWCPPCVQELPSLNRLHQEFEDRGLIVLGVSVDSESEPYRDFLEQWKVAFPTVRDPSMETPSRYGTSRYPETYLISPEGRVLRKYINAQNWMSPEIVNYLRSLL